MKRVVFFFIAFVCSLWMTADDFAIMRENLRREVFLGPLDYESTDPLIQAYITDLVKNATAYHNSLVKNPTTYLWSDYNKLKGDETYTCKHIEYSLRRLRTMAEAWAYPTSALYKDSAILADIKSSLNFLYSYALNEKTTLIGNFWEWRIGSPTEYSAIVSILYEELSATYIDHYYKSFSNFVANFARNGNMTYANQADVCRNLLYMGVLASKSADVTDAITCVKKAFVDETTIETRKKAQAKFEQMILDQGDYHSYSPVTKKEGFYEDGTFIQHTAIPYIGGYGSSMVNFTAEMQLIFAGTKDYAAPAYFYTAMPVWIEKAYFPAIYKGEMMRMFMGRNVNSSHSSHEKARAIGLNIYLSADLIKDSTARQRIINVCKTWYTDNAYYSSIYDGMNPIIDKPHIDAMIAAADADARPDEFNMVLAAGDRIIHETANWRLGIAMSSNRIGKFEGFSGNNMSGWYTGDGMTYIYTTDHREHWLKYFNYCNYYRMPGTTVDKITRTADGASIALFDNPVNAQACVGGVSLQGKYGAAIMSHVGAKSDLVAKKSWFMFDKEVVCLGAGISMSESREVETIVESRYINAGWRIDGADGTTKKCWEMVYSNPAYAYINDVGGYYFPIGGNIGMYIEQNKLYSIYFKHGKAPQNAAYAYTLLPKLTEAEVVAYSKKPATTIVSNTDTLQAAYNEGLDIVGINYYKAGKAASVSSDGEATVMLRHSKDTLYFSAAEPTWKRTQQTFVLDGVYTLISTQPVGKATVNYTNKNTTITINCTDRMGQGQQLILKTRQRMPKPGEEPAALTSATHTTPKGKKILENNQIVIIRNNQRYNILGNTLQ